MPIPTIINDQTIRAAVEELRKAVLFCDDGNYEQLDEFQVVKELAQLVWNTNHTQFDNFFADSKKRRKNLLEKVIQIEASPPWRVGNPPDEFGEDLRVRVTKILQFNYQFVEKTRKVELNLEEENVPIWVAFLVASYEGHLNKVESLLKNERMDPIHFKEAILLAFEKGHEEVVIQIMKDERMDSSFLSEVLFTKAFESGNVKVVKQLLDLKMGTPSFKDEFFINALRGPNSKVVRLLLDSTKNPPSFLLHKDFFIKALESGDSKVVQLLLKKTEINHDFRPELQYKALGIAAERRQRKLFQVLLNHLREEKEFDLEIGLPFILQFAEINHLDYRKSLLEASEKGYPEIVKLILIARRMDSSDCNEALDRVKSGWSDELNLFFKYCTGEMPSKFQRHYSWTAKALQDQANGGNSDKNHPVNEIFERLHEPIQSVFQMIPLELWGQKIFTFFEGDTETKAALRLVCSDFHKLVGPMKIDDERRLRKALKDERDLFKIAKLFKSAPPPLQEKIFIESFKMSKDLSYSMLKFQFVQIFLEGFMPSRLVILEAFNFNKDIPEDEIYFRVRLLCIQHFLKYHPTNLVFETSNQIIRWASLQKDYHLVSYLLGIDKVDPRDRQNEALRWALSKEGNEKVVELLCKGSRVNPQLKANATEGLKVAISKGRLKYVEILISHNASLRTAIKLSGENKEIYSWLSQLFLRKTGTDPRFRSCHLIGR